MQIILNVSAKYNNTNVYMKEKSSVAKMLTIAESKEIIHRCSLYYP